MGARLWLLHGSEAVLSRQECLDEMFEKQARCILTSLVSLMRKENTDDQSLGGRV